jgi:hypothetical protein
VVVSVTLRAFKIGWDDAKGPGRLYGGMRFVRNGKGCCFGNRLGHAGVLKSWRDYILEAPGEVSANIVMPIGAPIMIQEYNYKGPIAAAKEEAKKWKANGRSIKNLLKVRSYHNDTQKYVGDMEEKAARKGGAAATYLNVLLASLPDEAIEILSELATNPPKNKFAEATVILFPLGGMIAKPAAGDDAAAFSQRSAAFWLVVAVKYAKVGKEPTAEQVSNTDSFLADLATKLAPHVVSPSAGALRLPPPYKPGLGAEGTTKLAGGSVFSEAKLEKLREVKAKYDPDNMFWAVDNGMSCAHCVAPSAKQE